MLDLLRRKAQSTVIQVIIVAIILVFVFWGVGGQQGAGVNSVATVDDVPISYVDFQRAYNQQIDQLSGQFGGNIPAGLLETLGIKEQVLDGLIQRTLISLGAAETGLMASDVEVRNKIQDMEAFKQNGAFDVGWYKQILTGNRMTPTEFEQSMIRERVKAGFGVGPEVCNTGLDHLQQWQGHLLQCFTNVVVFLGWLSDDGGRVDGIAPGQHAVDPEHREIRRV